MDEQPETRTCACGTPRSSRDKRVQIRANDLYRRTHASFIVSFDRVEPEPQHIEQAVHVSACHHCGALYIPPAHLKEMGAEDGG